MPTVQIEGLPDMEFPDDTPQEVIDRVVKREVAAIKRPEQDTLTGGEESFQRGLRALQQVPHVREAIRRGTGKAIGTVARIGVPVGAAIAFPPSAGATIPQLLAYMGGMAAAGGAGEALGQAVAGEQASVPAVAGAALRSSVPATTPLRAGVSQAAANIAARMIEEGELPGLKAYGTETALPMALGLGGSVAGKIAAGLRGGAAAAADIERAGITPSIGQAFPSVARPAAAQETKLANLAKGQRAAAQLTEAEATAAGRFGPAPAPEEAAQRTAEAMGLPEARAIAAELRGEKPVGLVESLRARAQRVRGEQAVEAGTQAAEARAAGTLQEPPFRIQEAGRRVESIMGQLRDSLKARANQLYAPANAVQDVQAFDLGVPTTATRTSIAAQAKMLADQIPGIRTSGIGDLDAIAASGRNATLSELKEIRANLYDFADSSGEAIGKAGQRKVKQLIDTISETIKDQAPGALGRSAADAIQAGDAFYAANRPNLNLYGVRKAFAPETMERGTMGRSMAGAVAREGTQAPEFANIVRTYNELQRSGAQNLPRIEDLSDIVRSGIVDAAIDPATGAFTRKGLRQLHDTLSTIERQNPGDLARLGFQVNKQDLTAFSRLVDEAGNVAGKPDAIARLLTSTVGQTIAGPYLARLKNASGIGAIMDEMRANAVRDPNARQAVMDLSGWVSNDILQRAKAANWDLEKVLGNKDQQAALREIMGAPAFQTFKDIFEPAFKRMNVAAVAAGAAGTASQTAVEDILAQGARAATQAASGNLSNAGQNALGALMNIGKYKLIAMLIGQSAGSSGLLSKAQVAQRFNRALEAVGRQGVLQSETLKGIGNAVSGEPSEK